METKHVVIPPAALLGCAVGDALGMPFEALGPVVNKLLPHWEGNMLDGMHHKLPLGSYTDDTEMSLVLAEHLIEHNGLVPIPLCGAYLDWFKHGNTIGIGGTIKQAMQFLDGYALNEDIWKQSGQAALYQDAEEVGSGTVMRAAPLGVFYGSRHRLDSLRSACRTDAYITHNNKEAYSASLAVASLIAGAVDAAPQIGAGTQTRKPAMAFMMMQLEPICYDSITYRALSKYVRDEMWWHDSDAVADGFAGRWGSAWQIAVTGIHCALKNWTNFSNGVKEAVKLGGDTDTRGAVTGAILGAVLGADAIPEIWRKELKGKGAEAIYELDKALGQRT